MSQPLNILVVEDEYITQKNISIFLTEMGYNVIGAAMDADEAIEIINTKKVEFALLDINIKGEKDGIWLANYINENYKIPHVFLTAFTDGLTLKNAISTNPYGYLIKPFQKAELYSSIEIAILNFNKYNSSFTEIKDDFIFIKDNEVFEKVFINSILYIESQKNYLLVVTAQKNYRYRSTISDFFEKLPKTFIKSHKGFIVNKTKIESFNTNFIFINNVKIPISTTYKKDILQQLSSQ